MKRIGLSILSLAVVCCIVGCGREQSKRGALTVRNESDRISAPTPDEEFKKLAPVTPEPPPPPPMDKTPDESEKEKKVGVEGSSVAVDLVACQGKPNTTKGYRTFTYDGSPFDEPRAVIDAGFPKSDQP